MTLPIGLHYTKIKYRYANWKYIHNIVHCVSMCVCHFNHYFLTLTYLHIKLNKKTTSGIFQLMKQLSCSFHTTSKQLSFFTVRCHRRVFRGRELIEI